MTDVPDTPQTFVCSACGGTFEMGDDEAALAEYAATFPAAAASGEKKALVCDDCFAKIKPH